MWLPFAVALWCHGKRQPGRGCRGTERGGGAQAWSTATANAELVSPEYACLTCSQAPFAAKTALLHYCTPQVDKSEDEMQLARWGSG